MRNSKHTSKFKAIVVPVLGIAGFLAVTATVGFFVQRQAPVLKPQQGVHAEAAVLRTLDQPDPIGNVIQITERCNVITKDLEVIKKTGNPALDTKWSNAHYVECTENSLKNLAH